MLCHQACTAKNAEYQAVMTDAGALPHLADIAKGAAAQPYDLTEAAEMGKEKGLSQLSHIFLHSLHMSHILCVRTRGIQARSANMLSHSIDWLSGLPTQPCNKQVTVLLSFARHITGKSTDAPAKAGEASKDIGMARKALELLYSLASYFANHAALQVRFPS